MAIENLREIGNVLYEMRGDGMLYPVRRIRPDVAPSGVAPESPSILDIGGIGDRLEFLNKTFNPIEAIGGAMRAGERMMSPEMGGYDRLAALGDMLSGVAGVAAPAAALARTGAPAATALMEGLLGWSPTREAVGDTARAVGRDVVDRLNQRGPMPTTYSNPIPGLLGGADDVSIESVLRSKYPDVKISVSGTPERGYTLNKIDVPKAKRESGIGTAVMNDLVSLADQQGAIIKLSPSKDFGGSVPRLKDFYARFGFVPNKGKNADYSISESMYRTPSQPASPSLPTPRNDAEAMARDILQLRAEGRAADVTDEMMAAADPQYMYFNTPLPMDYASRMARAESIGLSPDEAYHGTPYADIKSMRPSEFGAVGPGVYVSRRTDTAGDYARGYGLMRPDVFEQDFVRYTEGGNVTPLRVPDNLQQFADWSDARMKDMQRQGLYGIGPRADEAATKGAKDLGFEGVAARNENAVIFDPARIRSRFARFDPEFAHLRNLSAAVAAGFPLGILAMQPDQEQY